MEVGPAQAAAASALAPVQQPGPPSGAAAAGGDGQGCLPAAAVAPAQAAGHKLPVGMRELLKLGQGDDMAAAMHSGQRSRRGPAVPSAAPPARSSKPNAPSSASQQAQHRAAGGAQVKACKQRSAALLHTSGPQAGAPPAEDVTQPSPATPAQRPQAKRHKPGGALPPGLRELMLLSGDGAVAAAPRPRTRPPPAGTQTSPAASGTGSGGGRRHLSAEAAEPVSGSGRQPAAGSAQKRKAPARDESGSQGSGGIHAGQRHPKKRVMTEKRLAQLARLHQSNCKKGRRPHLAGMTDRCGNCSGCGMPAIAMSLLEACRCNLNCCCLHDGGLLLV